MDAVQRRGWTPTWRKELTIDVNRPAFQDAYRGGADGPLGRFFHLRVTNRHLHRTATNCYGLLYRAERAGSGATERFGTVEFKWAGTVLPSVRIGPVSHRLLDAFWLDHEEPMVPHFGCFADSTFYVPQFRGPGPWLLDFGVVSDTLPSAKARFRLDLTGALETTTFTLVTPSAA